MGVFFSVAKKRRKCRRCGEMVPKGTPVMLNHYKAYPNSRWWTKDCDCFRCVMEEFENEAPNIWELYAIEKMIEKEGTLDA